jgi:hypothetical protein
MDGYIVLYKRTRHASSLREDVAHKQVTTSYVSGQLTYSLHIKHEFGIDGGLLLPAPIHHFIAPDFDLKVQMRSR